MEPPPVVVVMGVSGAGKSTIGAALAARRGWAFVEGDRLHPDANVARMAAGLPLDDGHRAPWLDAVADEIAASIARGEPTVVACSALRRRYRDRLRRAGPVRFVLLVADADDLAGRLADRRHEFMPAVLLEDQLATLEMPAVDETDVVVVTSTPDVDATLDAVDRAVESV